MNSPTPKITTAIPIVYKFRRPFVLVVAKEKQEQKQSELTITEFSQRWLREHRVKIKESTYVKYDTILQKHILPYFGQSTLTEITPSCIHRFSQKLLSQDHLAAKTTRDILCLLKTILEQLCPQKALPFSFKDIVLPKIPKKEIRILSREEEKRLISLLTQEENRYSLGILLALFTGMRIGEVCALRWRDISLSQQMIQVNATIQRIKNTDLCSGERTKILVDSPKSTSSIRCIPLTTFTTALLQKYKCDDPNAFLLSGSANRCVEPRGLQYYLKKYTTMLDLTGVHFHTLRHTFASRCAEVDFEIKSLSEVLGHSDPKITLERYIHPSLECKRTNMEKLSVYGY